MIAPILAVLAAGLLTLSAGDEAARKEYARLEGVWSFAAVDFQGAKQPAAPYPANKMVLLRNGRFPGICALTGETLKVCLGLRGKERPTEFESKPDSGRILFVFQREKQPAAEAMTEVGRQELTGTWQSVSYGLNGKVASAADLKKVKLVIDAAGLATALEDGKAFLAGNTKIDPMQEPMTMDVAYTAGAIKGQTALAIYKIEGDLLTICRSAPGKPRPTTFSSTPGSGLTLMSYRREKIGK